MLIVTPVAFTWLREKTSLEGGPKSRNGRGRRQAFLGCALPDLISLIRFHLVRVTFLPRQKKGRNVEVSFLDYKNLNIIKIWWPGRGLNPRRQPFQCYVMLCFKQLK